jgi:hypothetical protein
MPKKSGKPGLGRVVARRVLTTTGSGIAEVTISIGAPRRSNFGRWDCSVLIEGLGKPRLQSVEGGDSLQALLLAIGITRFNLDQTGNRFQWTDPESGSGIPRQVPTQYGRAFEERVNLLIEREAKRISEAKLKRNTLDIRACEAELKQRKELIEALETALQRRKAAAVNWEANLKNWRPGRQGNI